MRDALKVAHSLEFWSARQAGGFLKQAEKGYNLVAIRYKVVPVKDRPVLVYF